MQKLFLLALATVFLAACQSDDNITPQTSVVGNWELVEARSTWDNTVTPTSGLPFSDSYEFRVDGTFVKFNTHFGHELAGTYEEEITNPQNFPGIKMLTLTFTSANLDSVMPTDDGGNERNTSPDPFYFIIYGQGRMENLFLRTDGSLSNPGRGIADAPIYIYKR